MPLVNPGFHAFTIKANGQMNAIVTDLSVLPPFDPTNPPTPLPPAVATQALWDTGASRSVISTTLVAQLQLTPVGQTKVNHAGGQGTSPTYLVNYALPNGVGIAGVLVTEFPAPVGSFGAIIGMDVICLGDLAITNFSGETWMSFRTPSTRAVDYVDEHRRVAFSAVNRNDPCPCGKLRSDGKPAKYKHCHGA